MRLAALLVGTILLAGTATAQRPKFVLNAQTPEGRQLQMAAQESNDERKVAILEDFVQKNPKHEGVAWAWAQLTPLYLKAGQFDKAIAAATADLALDPANSVAAYGALQACEKKNDPVCVKDWSARTVDAAKKMLAIPEPELEYEVESWKAETEFAKQVITRCEYSLYAASLRTTDSKVIIDLGSALEQMAPDSQYFPMMAPRYMAALQQSGEKDRAAEVAEKAVAKDKTNEDTLYVAAEHYLQANTSPEKTQQYSQTLIDLMNSKPAPQGMDPEEWEKKKTTMLGLGYWMLGVSYSGESKWKESDEALRAALPYIKGKDELLGPAYLYIGVANYSMWKATKNMKLRNEAGRFFELCVAIKGPYRQQAIKNIKLMNAGR
jgi:tetratricopeptide (TPR) repeat protein